MTGSNRRPPACKAGALPAELIPRMRQSIEDHDPAMSRLGKLVGLVGFEPTTPALSRRCSNRLSYRPNWLHSCCQSTADKCGCLNLISTFFLHDFHRVQHPRALRQLPYFSRKEVIQPHLPIRLPCYDFTPVTNPAVVIALLAVRLTTSGRTRSHGVTGGVYKTRERIHRGKLIRDY
jgi:hypothetical protein